MKNIQEMLKAEMYISAIEEVENNRYAKRLSEFNLQLQGYRDEAHARGEKQVELLLQYEIEVLALQTQSPFIKEKGPLRFVPNVQFEDGSAWPIVENFTPEQIKYYEERLKLTNNVFLKARYADFLFEHGIGKVSINKYQIAKLLIPSFFEVSDSHLKQDNIAQFIVFFSRAVEVCLKMQIDNFLVSSLPLFEKSIVSIENNKGYIWITHLSKIMRNILSSKQSSLVQKSLEDSCFNALDKHREACWEDKDHGLHRLICEELICWKKIRGLSEDIVNDLLLEIGQSYEAEAIYQQGREEKSSIVKAHFNELAMRHYADIGKTEKVTEMKILIRKAYGELENSGELSSLSSEVSIPKEIIEDILQTFLKEEKEESLDMISKSIDFIPNPSVIEQRTKDLIASFPLQNLASQSVINDEKKVDHSNGNVDDSYRFSFSQNYMFDLQYNLEIILVNLFNRLISDKALNSDDIIKKIKSWSLLNPKNLPLVEIGIESFFKEDYVSSIHVLVPQFESTFRRMFNMADYSTTSIKMGTAQHEETFNEFLNRADIKVVLGEEIHKFIQMVMVEQTGFNLRNKVAHGLISISECNRSKNILVLYLFLLLTSFQLEINESES